MLGSFTKLDRRRGGGGLPSGRNLRSDVRPRLERVWRERQLTMVMATHDSVVAARAERTGIMRDGRLSVAPTSPDVGALRPGTDAVG